MSGRYRFRRRSTFRRSFRSNFRNNRTSIVRRARGNARAANAQADTTDVTINLMTKIKSGVTGWKNGNVIKTAGVIPVNIFELLRKSDFFNSYAPMYDQFRITSIKVKVTPVSWKTYNQFNLPNQITEYNITASTNNTFDGQTATTSTANPIEPGDVFNTSNSVGTPRINLTSDNHFLYPQALTVVTAWDRTGLDNTQIEDYGDVEGNMVCTIGDNITTYSSAKSTQLVAGANFNCTRYLYPSSQQEKALYMSTSDLKLQQNYTWSTPNNPYVIKQMGLNEGDKVIYDESYITNLKSSPNCPFKPTFLLGVLSIDPIKTDSEHTAEIDVSEQYMENQINPVTFNLEFDIGVTFRGLRKSQIVAENEAIPFNLSIDNDFLILMTQFPEQIIDIDDTHIHGHQYTNTGGPYKPISINFSQVDFEEFLQPMTKQLVYEHSITSANDNSYRSNLRKRLLEIDNEENENDENEDEEEEPNPHHLIIEGSLYKKVILDFSNLKVLPNWITYNTPKLLEHCDIWDVQKNSYVDMYGNTYLLPHEKNDNIVSPDDTLYNQYVNRFDIPMSVPIFTLTRGDIIEYAQGIHHNRSLRPDNIFELWHGMTVDYSKLIIEDPQVELDNTDITNAKTNNNGIIEIKDEEDEDEGIERALKLYYPVTIDVSNVTIPKTTPLVTITKAQLLQKSLWPIAELTTGTAEATFSIQIQGGLKLEPVTERTIVRYTEVVNEQLSVNLQASHYNCDGITQYSGTFDLPLGTKEITITNTNNQTINASTDQLIGYKTITVKNEMKLEPVTERTIVRYNEITNDQLLVNLKSSNYNCDGITEYKGTFDLPLGTKTINVNEGSNTTINASSDQYCGYKSVTIKVRGTEDPDFAPSVVYPIPITAFGVYTVSPLYCIPSSTICRSITFTFADLSAAVVAGGVMGLLPQVVQCNATITENGSYDYDPSEYPILNPTQNVCYSGVHIDVNVPNATYTTTITQNGTYTPTQEYVGFSSVTVNVPNSTQTKSITYNGTYTPDSGYIGFSSVSVNVPNSTQTKSVTSNGTYTPDSGYIGFSSFSVNVPNSTITKSITTNGTYTPDTGYIGFSSVSVNVPNSTTTKSITSNGTYTPSSGYIGFRSVTVNVPNSTQTKSITSNGTYTPDSGYIGFSSVSINVPNSTTSKSITSNGTYRPSSPYIGYSSVSVNVQPSLENRLIQSNGTYYPNSGYDGIYELNVQVTPNLQTRSYSYTTNGRRTITYSSGYDGLKQVTVNVDVPTSKPKIKNIYFNNYSVDLEEEYFGYNSSASTYNVPYWQTLLIIKKQQQTMYLKMAMPEAPSQSSSGTYSISIPAGSYTTLFDNRMGSYVNINDQNNNSIVTIYGYYQDIPNSGWDLKIIETYFYSYNLTFPTLLSVN